MKYLLTTVESYRVETESAADNLINEAKEDTRFILSKYTCTKKEIKKTEEEFYVVTLTKTFNDVKDCCVEVDVDYEVH